jgi:hypothetical protein
VRSTFEDDHDHGEAAFMSVMDLNFRTPGANVRRCRPRPNAQTDAMARASAGSPAGRHTSLFISSALRNFLTGI